MKMHRIRGRVAIQLAAFLMLAVVGGCDTLMNNDVSYPHVPRIANLTITPSVYSVSLGGESTLSFDYADEGLDILKAEMRDKNGDLRLTLAETTSTDEEGNETVVDPFPLPEGRVTAPITLVSGVGGEHVFTLYVKDEEGAISNVLQTSVFYIP